MDNTQFAYASRDDLWRVQNEMKSVFAVQAEHSDRLSRLEQRQDSDSRMKSVWGNSSPFPSILGGTPQQGEEWPSSPPLEFLFFFSLRFFNFIYFIIFFLFWMK